MNGAAPRGTRAAPRSDESTLSSEGSGSEDSITGDDSRWETALTPMCEMPTSPFVTEATGCKPECAASYWPGFGAKEPALLAGT